MPGRQRNFFDAPHEDENVRAPSPDGERPGAGETGGASCWRCKERGPHPGCGGMCLRCWAAGIVAPATKRPDPKG